MTDQHRDEVEAYKQGIIERNKARQGAPSGAPIPNLAEANVMYDVDRDGPATLAQMAKAQKTLNSEDDEPKEPRVQLAPQTVEGLKALKEATEKAQEGQELQKEPLPREDDPELLDDDLAAYPALGGFQGDVDPVKNDKERQAIAERVSPIDITEGLVNGEFRQHVPIVPGKFEVVFRTASPVEFQRARMLLVDMIDKDPALEIVLQELLSLTSLVAQIESINGKEEDRHMVGDSQYSAEFDAPTFQRKLNKYLRYPAPMIYSLGAHCDWFQTRVKECFTSENLKNG